MWEQMVPSVCVSVCVWTGGADGGGGASVDVLKGTGNRDFSTLDPRAAGLLPLEGPGVPARAPGLFPAWSGRPPGGPAQGGLRDAGAHGRAWGWGWPAAGSVVAFPSSLGPRAGQLGPSWATYLLRGGRGEAGEAGWPGPGKLQV